MTKQPPGPPAALAGMSNQRHPGTMRLLSKRNGLTVYPIAATDTLVQLGDHLSSTDESDFQKNRVQITSFTLIRTGRRFTEIPPLGKRFDSNAHFLVYRMVSRDNFRLISKGGTPLDPFQRLHASRHQVAAPSGTEMGETKARICDLSIHHCTETRAVTEDGRWLLLLSRPSEEDGMSAEVIVTRLAEEDLVMATHEEFRLVFIYEVLCEKNVGMPHRVFWLPQIARVFVSLHDNGFIVWSLDLLMKGTEGGRIHVDSTVLSKLATTALFQLPSTDIFSPSSELRSNDFAEDEPAPAVFAYSQRNTPGNTTILAVAVSASKVEFWKIAKAGIDLPTAMCRTIFDFGGIGIKKVSSLGLAEVADSPNGKIDLWCFVGYRGDFEIAAFRFTDDGLANLSPLIQRIRLDFPPSTGPPAAPRVEAPLRPLEPEQADIAAEMAADRRYVDSICGRKNALLRVDARGQFVIVVVNAAEDRDATAPLMDIVDSLNNFNSRVFVFEIGVGSHSQPLRAVQRFYLGGPIADMTINALDGDAVLKKSVPTGSQRQSSEQDEGRVPHISLMLLTPEDFYDDRNVASGHHVVGVKLYAAHIRVNDLLPPSKGLGDESMLRRLPAVAVQSPEPPAEQTTLNTGFATGHTYNRQSGKPLTSGASSAVTPLVSDTIPITIPSPDNIPPMMPTGYYLGEDFVAPPGDIHGMWSEPCKPWGLPNMDNLFPNRLVYPDLNPESSLPQLNGLNATGGDAVSEPYPFAALLQPDINGQLLDAVVNPTTLSAYGSGPDVQNSQSYMHKIPFAAAIGADSEERVNLGRWTQMFTAEIEASENRIKTFIHNEQKTQKELLERRLADAVAQIKAETSYARPDVESILKTLEDVTSAVDQSSGGTGGALAMNVRAVVDEAINKGVQRMGDAINKSLKEFMPLFANMGQQGVRGRGDSGAVISSAVTDAIVSEVVNAIRAKLDGLVEAAISRLPAETQEPRGWHESMQRRQDQILNYFKQRKVSMEELVPSISTTNEITRKILDLLQLTASQVSEVSMSMNSEMLRTFVVVQQHGVDLTGVLIRTIQDELQEQRQILTRLEASQMSLSKAMEQLATTRVESPVERNYAQTSLLPAPSVAGSVYNETASQASIRSLSAPSSDYSARVLDPLNRRKYDSAMQTALTADAALLTPGRYVSAVVSRLPSPLGEFLHKEAKVATPFIDSDGSRQITEPIDSVTSLHIVEGLLSFCLAMRGRSSSASDVFRRLLWAHEFLMAVSKTPDFISKFSVQIQLQKLLDLVAQVQHAVATEPAWRTEHDVWLAVEERARLIGQVLRALGSLGFVGSLEKPIG